MHRNMDGSHCTWLELVEIRKRQERGGTHFGGLYIVRVWGLTSVLDFQVYNFHLKIHLNKACF